MSTSGHGGGNETRYSRAMSAPLNETQRDTKSEHRRDRRFETTTGPSPEQDLRPDAIRNQDRHVEQDDNNAIAAKNVRKPDGGPADQRDVHQNHHQEAGRDVTPQRSHGQKFAPVGWRRQLLDYARRGRKHRLARSFACEVHPRLGDEPRSGSSGPCWRQHHSRPPHQAGRPLPADTPRRQDQGPAVRRPLSRSSPEAGLVASRVSRCFAPTTGEELQPVVPELPAGDTWRYSVVWRVIPSSAQSSPTLVPGWPIDAAARRSWGGTPGGSTGSAGTPPAGPPARPDSPGPPAAPTAGASGSGRTGRDRTGPGPARASTSPPPDSPPGVNSRCGMLPGPVPAR